MTPRTRNWLGIFAAAGVAATVASVGFAGASTSSPDNVYTAIEPCRLLDTRTATQVGNEAGPLLPESTITVTATGDNGNCTGIADDATAVTVHVSTTNATAARSFLTMYPTGLAERPLIAQVTFGELEVNLSNTTTVTLSADGQFDTYNALGDYDLVIDLLGYFAPGTAGEQGPAGPQGPIGPTGPQGEPGRSINSFQFDDQFCQSVNDTPVFECYSFTSASSNADNEAAGAPSYELTTVGNETTLSFNYRAVPGFLLCFEYRVDGEAPTDPQGRDNFNPSIEDGLWLFKCIDGAPADPTADNIVITDASVIEVRAVFGAEADERFNWEPNIIS